MKLTKRTKEIILWARQWAEHVSDEEVLKMWEDNISMTCDYNNKEFNFDIKERNKLKEKKNG